VRTTTVSTSQLKTYRTSTLIIIIGLTSFIVGYGIYGFYVYGEIYQFTTIFVWSYFAYLAVPAVLKIKNVSYDDGSVYYDKKGFEVQIPFEDIRDIEIKTISGIYKINLYSPSQDGAVIMFKTSLWYPFNFKKQDEKVNELRDNIDRYKRRMSERNMNELSSYQINRD